MWRRRPGADVIGVNNRDLNTFTVTLETSLELAEHMPGGRAAGQRERHPRAGGYRATAAAGYSAFLVGEHLMKSGDRAAALRRLVAA